METILITGSGGLVGSAAVRFFAERSFNVVGIDNDMRKHFFGESGSTAMTTRELTEAYPNFSSFDADIRNSENLSKIFSNSSPIKAVIHCAAQPSHDWAALDPITDFTVNANGTLGLLELTRQHAPEASFVFMSTNKVYGDTPNRFDFVEEEYRWSPTPGSPHVYGFSEVISIDGTTHSLFGVSKASADLMVQEYGRYFGMNTVCFRGGCLTGPGHAGVELHGFLSYLVKATVNGYPYTVFGHKAKQVRDNIHTDDLVEAFWEFIQDPDPGAVYNIGGGLDANVSMMEAISKVQEMSGNTLDWTPQNDPRIGDHIWYVSDLRAFKRRYPAWGINKGIDEIIEEMVDHELRSAYQQGE